MVMVILLAACSPAVATQVEPTPSVPPTAEPVPTQPVPTQPVPAGEPTLPVQGDEPKGIPGSGGMDPNGPVIVYSRTGGIAGTSERWELYPDGRVVSREGDDYQVEPQQIIDLVAAFEQAGFFEMQHPAGPGGNCADCFTYEVAVRLGEKSNQLSFTDVDSNLSAEFMQTMQQLNEFLDGLKP